MTRTLDFLTVGVQKGGTSSLHTYLAEHPSLCLSQPKELHLFDNETRDWSAPLSFSFYFSHATPGQLWGETTPIYLFWPPALLRIAKHNPGAKLICLLRDPVERAYSHWRMEVARGAEHLPFSTAIREGRKRIGTELDHNLRTFSYVERGFYAAQIERAQSIFSSEQLLFLRSEDLLDHKATALDQICKFLSVPPFQCELEETRIRPHNPPSADRMRDDDRTLLLSYFADDLAETFALTGVTWDC